MMMFGTLLMVLLLASDEGKQPADSRNAIIEIRCPAECVAGLPIPIQISAQGPISITASYLLNDVNPFDLVLRSDKQSYVWPKKAFTRVPRRNPRLNVPDRPDPGELKLPAPVDRLKAGERAQYVLDLSLLDMEREPIEKRKGDRQHPQPVPLKAGLYHLEVKDAAAKIVYLQNKIEVFEPNDEEMRILKAARSWSEASLRPRWRIFVEASEVALASIDPARLSARGKKQLEYHVLLARLIREDLSAEITLAEAVRECWPVYQSEILLLRYEWANLQGKTPLKEETGKSILRLRPNAGDALRLIDSGAGLITQARSPQAKR